MTIAKIRSLSQYGVNTDADPFNLPPSAFSWAANVRFKQGSVEPAPVFKRVPLTLAFANPRFLAPSYLATGGDRLAIGYLNGRVSFYNSGTETDLSISGYVDAESDTPYTACRLGEVFYVNRSDRVPWSIKTSDTEFHELDNWDASWRAGILRSCNSSLCAFNIVKGADTFPTMVKTSSPAVVNNVPDTWDETDTTANAYENIFAEMEGQITEAQPLGQTMMVYGLKEAWQMTPTSSSDIWDVRKVFGDVGCINANCAVEVDKKHFVFGLNDIWMHDGVSKTSISDQKVRRYIFSALQLNKAQEFFVKYDDARKEIRFNFVTHDGRSVFTTAAGCTRSAVYYIPEQTWTFDDLPYVFGAATANLDTSQTWATISQTWDASPETWYAEDVGLSKTLVMVGEVSAVDGLSASLYAMDEQGPGEALTYTVDANANATRVLERDGIDLDELEEVEKLTGYKVISTIFPQARFSAGSAPLEFSFGAALNYDQAPTFTDPQSYDGVNDTRCDFNDGGRYFFLRVQHDDYRWFRLTGFDLDIFENGQI